ncbi:MAG: nickel pincer cofactor biosynthesis protein LarC [Acidobacteria bacterium]|nr:MAG: nickel pincer cofactor biosynthesis protein LarC [Acidobacteriota bacterium]
MKTLYFDCFSGISGDMTIGALLDLGLDFDYLKSELHKLPVDGYQVTASRVTRSNISAMKFDVLVEGEEDHAHHHHDHGQEHTHSHFHRKASQILAMIRDSNLSANTKRIASEIFTKLAISEGTVHHIAPEDVEFHEVGAIHSIVDTVGTAIGFDALGIERFLCSAINIGSGFIHCQHGVLPVPAPATADLLRHATIYQKHAETELVTPTGAAILAAVVNRFDHLTGFSAERIGYGAGTKQFPDFPNCLRLMLGEERSVSADAGMADVTVIEANIDDMNPQNFGYVTQKLLNAGALDVFTIPIQMKKGRPGQLLQVLAGSDAVDALSRMIFQETTTIGVRRYRVDRTTLDRELVDVETEYGTVKMKVSKMNGEVVNFAPEFEDCARIAQDRNVPLKRVQAAAVNAYLSGL